MAKARWPDFDGAMLADEIAYSVNRVYRRLRVCYDVATKVGQGDASL
ncbi:MAG: hypothetical protein AAGA08_12585 [Pseudomonadota bacterium]